MKIECSSAKVEYNHRPSTAYLIVELDIDVKELVDQHFDDVLKSLTEDEVLEHFTNLQRKEE